MMIKTCAALALTGMLSMPAYAGIDGRQAVQQQRIENGRAAGQLTRLEAARLSHQQARIDRAEARMRADGGGLNAIERARLHVRQDRASANIFRQRNDRQF
ncbi:hypothetical protein [Dokdonella sp.]|uniref:hypothetical protein n=1 Tax=Dokdonella sp. TaxID=2291710 RepID=UPI0025BA4AD1|nr:hypothetical protein [Dokdonella sp.]MBX3693314.1 hypothetical protein [Dokdonella sp.]MCW5568711.1 hypothetical protein [Dokdonella sp.]